MGEGKATPRRWAGWPNSIICPGMIQGHRRKKQLLASRSHQFEYLRFRLEHVLEHELFCNSDVREARRTEAL